MDKTQKIIEAYKQNPNFNRTKFALENDTDTAYIRKILRKFKKKNNIPLGKIGNEDSQYANDGANSPPPEKIEFTKTSGTSAKLDLQSLTITTLEQALEVANVDLTEWKVDRYTIGSWQVTLKARVPTKRMDDAGNVIYRDKPKTVTMYKIQVWLKMIQNIAWVRAIKDLIKEMPQAPLPRANREKLHGDRYLLEVALMDVHFGMLAWGKESGYDWDLDITENFFLYAVDDLLNKSSGYRPAKILFPFGNDYLHIDDPTNATPANRNPLDVDSRLIKIYQKAKLSVIKAIDRCRNIAPVDVLWIPGNHDPNVSYYLCDAIKERFRNDEYVTVNQSPKVRKYYPWGNGLIVYTHGVEEPIKDLPGIIATEEPRKWGDSKYREIHIGHKHKKMEMKWISVDTHHGAVVRMIPSIACPDAWHYKRGFIQGYHAAEAYLWDTKFGMIGRFTSYIDREGE